MPADASRFDPAKRIFNSDAFRSNQSARNNPSVGRTQVETVPGAACRDAHLPAATIVGKKLQHPRSAQNMADLAVTGARGDGDRPTLRCCSYCVCRSTE